MESVKSARARLGSYPLHLASCAPEAANYGRCDKPNISDIGGLEFQSGRVKMTCVHVFKVCGGAAGRGGQAPVRQGVECLHDLCQK